VPSLQSDERCGIERRRHSEREGTPRKFCPTVMFVIVPGADDGVSGKAQHVTAVGHYNVDEGCEVVVDVPLQRVHLEPRAEIGEAGYVHKE